MQDRVRATSLPELPKTFSGELRFAGGCKELYVNGEWLRQDLKTDGEFCEMIIYRPDIEVLWRYSGGDVAVEIPMSRKDAAEIRGDIHASYKWLRQETVSFDGKPHLKFTGEWPGGSKVECLVDADSGMRRKMMFFDRSGAVTNTEEWVDVSLSAPPSHVFDLPEGIGKERIQMPTR